MKLKVARDRPVSADIRAGKNHKLPRMGRHLLQRSKIGANQSVDPMVSRGANCKTGIFATSIASDGARRKHLVAEGSLLVEALDKRGIDERCEIQIARFGVGVANHFEKDLHGAWIGVRFFEQHVAVGFVAFLKPSRDLFAAGTADI